MEEVYWDREQFVSYISEWITPPSAIAETLRFVEGCFVLASSADAKVYVMEVPEGIDRDKIVEMTEYLLKIADIPVVMVPSGFMQYKATLKADNLGIKGKVMAVRDKLKGLVKNG